MARFSRFKQGILTAAGAKKLGVPHLARHRVDYEPQHDAEEGGYAGEIYYQGRKLGRLLMLGNEGILPGGQEVR